MPGVRDKHDHVLMEDGLVHLATEWASPHRYFVQCDRGLLFDLDDNGSIVLEPLTCLLCAT